MRNSITVLALVGSSLLTLSACGSDDDAAASIDGVDEWCTTMGEVDELLASGDSNDDFAEVRDLYGQASREAQRLLDAVDVVDESARADVTTTLQFVVDLTTAVSGAPDEAAAETALAPFFESFQEGDALAGDTWILDNCGVDIND